MGEVAHRFILGPSRRSWPARWGGSTGALAERLWSEERPPWRGRREARRPLHGLGGGGAWHTAARGGTNGLGRGGQMANVWQQGEPFSHHPSKIQQQETPRSIRQNTPSHLVNCEPILLSLNLHQISEVRLACKAAPALWQCSIELELFALNSMLRVPHTTLYMTRLKSMALIQNLTFFVHRSYISELPYRASSKPLPIEFSHDFTPL